MAVKEPHNSREHSRQPSLPPLNLLPRGDHCPYFHVFSFLSFSGHLHLCICTHIGHIGDLSVFSFSLVLYVSEISVSMLPCSSSLSLEFTPRSVPRENLTTSAEISPFLGQICLHFYKYGAVLQWMCRLSLLLTSHPLPGWSFFSGSSYLFHVALTVLAPTLPGQN